MLDAAKAMKLTANDLLKLDIIDEIVKEPTGGAHRDKNLVLQNVRESIEKNLDYFNKMSPDEIFTDRKNKFLKVGRGKGFISNLDTLSDLKSEKINLFHLFKSNKKIFGGVFLAISIFLLFFLFL